jgi:hypothetical protein
MREALTFRGGNRGTITVSSAKELGKQGISMNPNALPSSWGSQAPFQYLESLGRYYGKHFVYIPHSETPHPWLEQRRMTIKKRAPLKVK